MVFLSTPSARRATEALRATRVLCRHFYPRPPRGGRLYWLRYLALMSSISIHALREEGDSWLLSSLPPKKYFYPRPPRGGRPVLAVGFILGLLISIHALREEGDQGGGFDCFVCGKFLSTPSARRATASPCASGVLCGISIHALREEGDSSGSSSVSVTSSFLSTPSARRATPAGRADRGFRRISIHALREEGDRVSSLL